MELSAVSARVDLCAKHTLEVKGLRLFGLLATYAGLWLLMTPYAGLSHDAQAYAFQALARLDPTVFGQDVFLRFESQDRYTVFPAIYGALIGQFGLEATAAALTLLLHVLWFGGSLLLARRLLGMPLALLSLGLLIAFPGPYGGLRVFHMAEPFLTARLPAEVLAIFAIWAFIGGHRVIALGLLGLGMVVHPLMVFPVLLFIGLMAIESASARPNALPLSAIAIVAGALVGSVVLGGRSPTMDSEWIEAARTRSGFLFPADWRLADWNHTLLTLFTLALAGLSLPTGLARTAARCAFWLGASGLLLAAVAGEIWNLQVLLQGQPWRWLWLGRWCAIALLPIVLLSAWGAGPAGRACAALLVAAWTIVLPVSARNSALALMGALFGLLSLVTWLFRTRLPSTTQALLQRGAVLVLGLVLLATVATALLVGSFVRADSELSPLVQRLLGIAYLITPVVLVVVATWLGWCLPNHPARSAGLAAATGALLVIATPQAVNRWTAESYGPENQARFSGWRERIPRDAEVFWWDGLREVWFLLQRRSYLTVSQGGGLIFSAETSRELRRRADNVSAFIDPGFWLREPDALSARPRPFNSAVMAQICRDPALGFVVTGTDLRTGAPKVEWTRPGRYVFLYDCNDFRKAGAS
jgi:hypothetical protein